MNEILKPGKEFIPPTEYIKQTGSPDLKAFEFFYDRHSPKLLGYIMQSISSKPEAEKILVKVFLKLWNVMKTLENVDDEKLLKLLISYARLYLFAYSLNTI